MTTEWNFHKRILCVLLSVLLFISGFCVLFVNARATVTPNVCADSYEEYLEITKVPAFADHFIRYEQIKCLGKFGMFVGPHYPYNGSPDNFTDERLYYIVVDKNGFELALYIDKMVTEVPKERLEKEAISMPSGLRDMRKLDSEETGSIKRGPLYYRYLKGELSSIHWFLGDRLFVLFPNPYNSSTLKGDADMLVADYPTDGKNTICNLLLSSNYLVALFAYYKLIGDIPLQSGETWFSRMQYIIWSVVVPVLLIAACIAAVCIFRRIRKKKRIMASKQENTTGL